MSWSELSYRLRTSVPEQSEFASIGCPDVRLDYEGEKITLLPHRPIGHGSVQARQRYRENALPRGRLGLYCLWPGGVMKHTSLAIFTRILGILEFAFFSSRMVGQ